MPTPIYLIFAAPAAAWLMGVIACLFALRWSIAAVPRRFWAAIVVSAMAIVIGYVGLTRYKLSYSKNSSDGTHWSINSKWFFISLIILGAVTLGLALWRRSRPRQIPPIQIDNPTARTRAL